MSKMKDNSQIDFDRILRVLNQEEEKPMSFTEACNYLNLSKSYLYKLTSSNVIPFYKPNGKKIFFSKSELNEWIFKNKIKSESELREEAEQYLPKRRNVLK